MTEYIVKCNELTTVTPIGNKLQFPDYIDYNQEVVRCRDCKHYEYWEFRDGRIAHDCARGGDYLFDTEPNGYCKWGERREDA